MFKIRPIELDELPLLQDLPAPDWGYEIPRTFAAHYGKPYFYPIVATVRGAIVGCASGWLYENTGWLSNVVVQPEYRGYGIGTALTAHLIECLRSRGCVSQTLLATPMGERIYRRLGFATRSTYAFLHRDRTMFRRPVNPNLLWLGYPLYKAFQEFARKLVAPSASQSIRRAESRDFDTMLCIDQEITGERRGVFLEQYLAGAWVYEETSSEPVTGFFLPALGSGPIIARDPRAGLALLRYQVGNATYVVPMENAAALDFLMGVGFRIKRTLPRMTLGSTVHWRPSGVYKLGAHYFG